MKKLLLSKFNYFFSKKFWTLKGFNNYNFIIALFILFASLSSFKGEIRQQKEKYKQCIGITRKGERCKRKLRITIISNYCFQHNADTDKQNKK